MIPLANCPFCGSGPGPEPHGHGGVRIAMSRYLTGKWAPLAICRAALKAVEGV